MPLRCNHGKKYESMGHRHGCDIVCPNIWDRQIHHPSHVSPRVVMMMMMMLMMIHVVRPAAVLLSKVVVVRGAADELLGIDTLVREEK